MCMGGLTGLYGNTAQQWEKTDWTLHQPWIGKDQSAASNFSQSAMPPVSQSQLRPYALSNQSETSNPGSFCYKSRCRSQFVSSVSPRMENSTVSSIGYRILQQSNTPVRHQSTTRVSCLSDKPVRCSATGIVQQSNTPVRWKSTIGVNCLSNGPVRRQAVRSSQLSNTPVRRQPSSSNSTLTCLLRSLWSNCRIRRRRTRRRKFQKCNLMCALCVATRIWGLPIIGDTCCRFIRWIWSGLLWCMTTTSTRAIMPILMTSQSPPRRELCEFDNSVRHSRTIDNAIVLSHHPCTVWIRQPSSPVRRPSSQPIVRLMS